MSTEADDAASQSQQLLHRVKKFRLSRKGPIADDRHEVIWLRSIAQMLACTMLLWCSACALAPDRDLTTSFDQDAATLTGFATMRAWADGPLVQFAATLASSRLNPRSGHDVNYLALSGGGAGGAFAAGVLEGWTREGSRPEFDMVSGVSTGALIAPFAFLGPSYDPLLKALYSDGGTEGLDTLQNPISMLRSGGVVDPGPLRRLVERYATKDMLRLVALEHRRGRRLLVVTTNLDAQRPVVWNLGAIAASDRPDALPLFRDVLIASASVPGIYPPVLLQARNAQGRGLQEMHVDGSAMAEVFVEPSLLRPVPEQRKVRREAIHIWVVINNTLTPEYSVTPIAPLAIAGRSLSTLAKSQTIWIVKAAQQEAQALGMDFNIAQIDSHVPFDGSHPFALDYMRTVYRIGQEEILAHTLWRKSLLPFTQSASAPRSSPEDGRASAR